MNKRTTAILINKRQDVYNDLTNISVGDNVAFMGHDDKYMQIGVVTKIHKTMYEIEFYFIDMFISEGERENKDKVKVSKIRVIKLL
jgi:hypothetical protein